MASKRPHQGVQQYAENSFSDEDDGQNIEYEQEQQHPRRRLQTASRLGRPRRVSDNSPKAAPVGVQTTAKQEISPAQTANLPGAGAARRKGRGPSKKAPLNRNALLARENRQRKKAYLKDIEDKLNKYNETNKALSNIIEKQKKQLQDLVSQVNYYQSLVANQYEITTLLAALNEAMKALHGSKDTITSSLSTKVADALKNVNQNVDKFKWSANREEITSNPNSQSAPLSSLPNSNRNPDELDEGAVGGRPQSLSFGQIIPRKIARKTMPLTSSVSVGTSSLSTVPKTTDLSSVESLFLDDNDVNKFEQSPESHSY